MHCETAMPDLSLSGLLLIDKPKGPTSHHMVDAVRRALGGARVGHVGTLDPMATGLLVMLVGRATRLAPYVPGDPKRYSASMLLGMETETMDLEGKVLSDRGYAGRREEVEKALSSLVGEWEQTPPAYSAVKHRGKPAYRYARKGERVELASRKVRIYRVEVTAFRRLGNKAEVDFLVECSPGTYVRELAARIGGELSCGGTLSRLRREASGPFKVEDALGLEEFKSRLKAGEKVLLPMHMALGGMKSVEVKADSVPGVVNGGNLDESKLLITKEDFKGGDMVAVMGNGELLAVHEVTMAKPFSSRPLRVVGTEARLQGQIEKPPGHR